MCQAASLACNELLRPVDTAPDLTGRWYVIAISSDTCLVPAAVNAFLWPSVAFDISSAQTPNIYEAAAKIKMYGYCANESESFFYDKSHFFDLDKNNAPTGEPDVLLTTGCPDCLIIKFKEVVDAVLYLSKRQAVTTTELAEFGAQAQCLGWYKPQVFNSDHDYTNCKSFDDIDDDDDDDHSATAKLIYQRWKTSYKIPFECFCEKGLSSVASVLEWIENAWKSLY